MIAFVLADQPEAAALAVVEFDNDAMAEAQLLAQGFEVRMGLNQCFDIRAFDVQFHVGACRESSDT